MELICEYINGCFLTLISIFILEGVNYTVLQATSLNGLVNQGSKTAGPLLGGFALSMFTPQWCILLNIGLRVCSFLLLLTVKNIQSGNEANAARVQEEWVPLRTMWREGWSFMFRSKLLLNMMLYGLISILAIQMIDFQFTSCVQGN